MNSTDKSLDRTEKDLSTFPRIDYLSGELPFLVDDEGTKAKVGGAEHRMVDCRGVQGLGGLPPEGADDPVGVGNNELVISVPIWDDFQIIRDLSDNKLL